MLPFRPHEGETWLDAGQLRPLRASCLSELGRPSAPVARCRAANRGRSRRQRLEHRAAAIAACRSASAVPKATPATDTLSLQAVAGMLVAANPERPGDLYPWGHIVWASIGLGGVATWPAGAWRRGPEIPWALRPAVAAAVVTVLLALVMWFGAELITGAGQAGLAERVAGAAQALWPLAVVLSCCRRPARAAATVPSAGGRDDGH